MITTLVLAFALQASDLEAAVANASSLGEKGQFAAAVSTLEDAGVTDSQDAGAWHAYATWGTRQLENDIAAGRIAGLEIVDEFMEMAWRLEKASQCTDAPVQVWVDWSEVLLNANDIPNSLKTLESGLGTFRNDALLLAQRGRVQLAKARAAKENGNEESAAELKQAAESSFRKAISSAPKSAAPRLRLAELLWLDYLEGGASSEPLKKQALESWVAAASNDPEGVDPNVIYQWLGTESVPVYDKLIEAQPEQVLHYWYRGSAFYALGPDNWPQLRDDFLKVLEINPDFSNAYYFLADGAMQRGTQQSTSGDQQTAERAYSAAAGFWAEYLKGFGNQYRMQLKQAGGDGGLSVAQNMNWLAGKKDFATGVVLLRWAVGTIPDYADAWNNLAYFLRETGESEASRDAYQRALELQPTDPQVMNDYAVIFHYYLKERLDYAEELYIQAAERAQEMLDNNEVAEEDMQRITIALRDAKNNLARLRKGETEE